MARKPQAEFPGVRFVDDYVRAYTTAWKDQSTALSAFWTTLTSGDVSFSSVVDSYGQLVSAYGTSVKNLMGMCWPVVTGPGGAGCPVVPFVVDGSAQGVDPVEIVLPAGTNVDDVKTTPLASGATALSDKPLEVRAGDLGRLLISLNLAKIPAASRNAQYSSIVYDSDQPPPFKPLALVIVTFA